MPIRLKGALPRHWTSSIRNSHDILILLGCNTWLPFAVKICLLCLCECASLDRAKHSLRSSLTSPGGAVSLSSIHSSFIWLKKEQPCSLHFLKASLLPPSRAGSQLISHQPPSTIQGNIQKTPFHNFKPQPSKLRGNFCPLGILLRSQSHLCLFFFP